MELPALRARRAVVIAVAAVILAFSVAPTLPDPVEELQRDALDKVWHAAAYAFLAVSMAFATVERRRSGWGARAVYAFALGYGALMEMVQGPLPSRSLDLLDLAADAIGALAVLPWTLFERRFAQP